MLVQPSRTVGSMGRQLRHDRNKLHEKVRSVGSDRTLANMLL